MKKKHVLALVLTLSLMVLCCAGCGKTPAAEKPETPENSGEEGFMIATVEPESMDATNKPLYDNLRHAVEAMGGTYLGLSPRTLPTGI